MKEKNCFWRLLEKKVLFWIYLGIGAIFSVISIIAPIVSGELVNAVIYEQEKLGVNLLGLVTVYGMLLFFSVLDQYCTNVFLIKQKTGMRKKAFGAFLRKENLNREKISSFVSFVNNDIPGIAENYFQGTVDIIKCSCITLGVSVALLQIHWTLALIIGVSSLLMVSMPKLLQKKAATYRERYAKALEKYNTVLASYLEGADIVKVYGYRERAHEETESKNQRIEKEEGQVRGCQLGVYGMAGGIQIAKNFLVLAVGVSLIYMQEMKVGELLAAVQLAEVLGAPIEVLAYLINGKNEIQPLVKKYRKMIAKTEVTGEAFTDKIETIQMEHVRVSVDDTIIVNDFSVLFEAGKKYMLVGKSGSGKTTLLRILSKTAGMDYDGVVSLNKTDFARLEEVSFYKKIGVVLQEPYLFWDTMEENILLGRAISREDYLAVVEKLNLKYLLERFENQPLDEVAVSNLSGGEKQRIALARAMVGKPEVYLLDEITSSLDASNAYDIEQALLKEDAMVIHACHKIIPELRELYDEVLSLD